MFGFHHVRKPVIYWVQFGEHVAMGLLINGQSSLAALPTGTQFRKRLQRVE